MYEDVPTVIKDYILGGNVILNEYRSKLDEIGKIENPHVRIRKVFELARSYQGSYHHNQRSLKEVLGKMFLMRGGIGAQLQRAKSTGIGGQCRDFARLLTWSLMEVQRSPKISSQYRSWGTLDKNSFSARTVFSNSPEHVWVEVKIPKAEGKGIGDFDAIHLDSTYYEDFAPLYPRHSGVSKTKRMEIQKGCKSVLACLVSTRLDRVGRSQEGMQKNRGTH